ncbi:MAG: PDZ domain-containing protein [Deltaproteobacteria bacterium]|nr:PDZ domain-containing protein [Myxococcales bacterium]MDP3216005.1 PDZ domain-containing protein [Deltaproteobacteria bacterium]
MATTRWFIVAALASLPSLVGCGAVFPRYTTATRSVPADMVQQRAIAPPPDDVRTVSVLSAELPPSRTDGQPWDSDGEPDLYAVILRDGVEVYRTPVVQNSLRPEWRNATVTLRVRPDSVLRFELWDADGMVDQPVGAEQVTGVPASALDGGNWVIRYQRNAFLRLAARPPEPRFGMGVTFEVHEDHLRVLAVEEGGPGAAAGLRVGDRIVALDRRRVQDLGEIESHQAMDRASLRPVTLTVERDGSPPATMTVAPGAVYSAR